ncbi:STAS domain-containing protein [Blastococcus sp. PRF04-17]|uniref:STAS domain-containing protein n=1 Tax=Blastococcus sp. PRF04-17 TaxID=2933797 RepID=UPI001FF12F1A|nr:STAS domain-containing protein [Blastococcus sp. PRF04-17]UOY03514.1 STAS domain-containing protein [Blastococcus sp. PRF04-17]
MPLLTAALVPSPYQVVVRLTGDADLSTTPVVTDALARAAGLGTPHVVVDVAGARFWDVSVLHALVSFTAELGTAGRGCRIVGALRATRRLISAAQLTDRLHLDGPSPARALPRADDGLPARRPVSEHPVPVRGLLAARAAASLRPA